MEDLWLAACNVIAVYSVGGWWKPDQRKDRLDLPVRYALLVSLKTSEQGIDGRSRRRRERITLFLLIYEFTPVPSS
jgi:hypothetical protein